MTQKGVELGRAKAEEYRHRKSDAPQSCSRGVAPGRGIAGGGDAIDGGVRHRTASCVPVLAARLPVERAGTYSRCHDLLHREAVTGLGAARSRPRESDPSDDQRRRQPRDHRAASAEWRAWLTAPPRRPSRCDSTITSIDYYRPNWNRCTSCWSRTTAGQSAGWGPDRSRRC